MVGSTTLEVPVPSNISGSWTNLKSLIRTLERTGSTLGNIRDALEQFFQLIEVHERFESTWNENGAMKHELETSFQRLHENCAKPRSGMTGCMRGLCRDIKVELSHIRHYSLVQPNDENRAQGDDSGKLLERYRRIQVLLRSLLLNTGSSVWDVLEQDTCLRTHSYTCENYNYTLATEQDSCMRPAEVRGLNNWVQNSPPGAICWVPNTRKMGISRALCAELDATHKLGASLFFSRESCDFNSIIPSIAYQLANYSTPFRLSLLNPHPQAFPEPLEVQFEKLIANPLARVRAALPAGLVVVIDVMNGCGSVRPIIDAILANSDDLPIRFFIFSRPELCYDASDRLFVHEVGGGPVMEGVEGELRAALKPFGLPELQLADFVQRAGALFTCAAVVAHHIGDDTSWLNHSALVDG
ncbi:unnamed protein product [Rhizoctonia solani]|uniref:Nephrocystin 3-like N-terminal domain-containing protein n=1 Tax=Rhizoctonia solani TaxID=456999 RepID=A0A8H2XK82_9AGAM|nr:unnamed protein product [Rhizoctonia solani]